MWHGRRNQIVSVAETPRGSLLSSTGFLRLRLQQLELKQPVETMSGSPQNPETSAPASDLYSLPSSNVQEKFVMCSRHCHQDPSRKHRWTETRQSLPDASVSQSLHAWGNPRFPSTHLLMCLPNWTPVCSQSTEDTISRKTMNLLLHNLTPMKKHGCFGKS